MQRLGDSIRFAGAVRLQLSLLVWFSLIPLATPVNAQRLVDAEAAAVQERLGEGRISGDNLERWVFQQYRTAAAARKNFLSELTLQIAELDRICELEETQRRQLSLAGRGDIVRFFRQFAEMRHAFEAGKQAEQDLRRVFDEIAPLQASVQAGLFDRESLIRRSLPRILTGEQLATYREVQRDRQRFHHRTTVEWTVSLLEQAVPLRAVQRERLIAILERETRPPAVSGQHDYYSILYQFGLLPAEQFTTFLTDEQWHILHQHLAQAKTMEPWLQQRGGLPAKESDDHG